MKAYNSKPNSESSTLARGTIVNLLGKFIGRGFHLVTQVILARFLGPFAFGLYAIGWNFLRIFGMASTLGLDNGVIHIGLKNRQKLGLSKVVYASVIMATFSGFVIGFILFFSSSNIARLFDKPDLGIVIRIFSIGLPLLAGVKVASAATRATKKMKYANFIEEFVQPLTNLILFLILFSLSRKTVGAAVAGVLSFAASYFLALYYLTRVFPDKVKIQSFFSIVSPLVIYSIPTSVTTMIGIFILLADRVLVGYFLIEEQAGIYQAVSLISVIFVSILSALKMIIAPMVAENYGSLNLKSLEYLYKTSTRWLLIISLPVFLVLLIAPKIVISILFGTEYITGYFVLKTLCVAQLIKNFGGVADQLLIMSGNQISWLKTMFWLFFAYLVTSLVLIPMKGIQGAAYSITIIFTLMSTIGVLQVKKTLGIWPFCFESIKIFLAAVFTGIILVLIERIHWASLYLEISVLSLSSVAIFLAIIYLMGLSNTDQQLLLFVNRQIKTFFGLES